MGGDETMVIVLTQGSPQSELTCCNYLGWRKEEGGRSRATISSSSNMEQKRQGKVLVRLCHCCYYSYYYQAETAWVRVINPDSHPPA